MALPASGTITLNQIHVEAGGSSGTPCTLNESDIRGLIGASINSSMEFSDWYGAVNEFVLTISTLGSWSTNLPGAARNQRYGFQSYNSYGATTGAVAKTGYFGGNNVVASFPSQVQPNDSAATVFLEASGNITNTDDDAFASVSVNGLASYSRSAASFSYDGSRSQWSWSTTLAVGYGIKSPMVSGSNTLTFTK
jgi:hypothetical protein